ncbi:MAG: TonB-dependent receptor [Gammaproteobacteria bacterium]|nr:TonB-dependent receptor [Gammaproteobacteria bacterium]
MHHSIRLFVFLTAAAAISPVASAEDLRDTVVVTASRMPIPLMAAGSSVSVIDREQIEARQATFAVDLLRDVPGFAVSRSGSIGAQTQVRVRGAEANQLLVLIDGIEANDPAGNDEFAFQDLTTWDVERIEVVRGPQSALWGSDALAGVVNIITREPTGEFSAEGFAEMGAFDTGTAGARIAGAIGGIRTGLSVSRIDANGSNSSRAGGENDGYENTTATLTLAGSPYSKLDLGFVGRYTSTSKQFDGVDFGTGLPADSGDETAVDLGYFRAGGTLKLLDDRWTQSLRAAWTTTDTENRGDFGSAGSTAADKYGVYYQTSWQFTPGAPDSPGNALTLAVDHELQDFRQRGAVIVLDPDDPMQDLDPNQDQDQRNTAAVLELVLSPLERTSISVSGRYDDYSEFDNAGSFRATTAWATESTKARLHASFGTGQKAPTFIERFGYFPDQFTGNPDLEPETSTGWEVGVEQPLFDNRASIGATYFHEDLENEIDGFAFNPDTFLFTAANLDGHSKRRGVEVSASASVSGTLRFSGSYTYTDATQPDPASGEDTREIRRPRHVASFNGHWRFPDRKADLNLNLTYIGHQDDLFFEVAPPYGTQTIDLNSYYLVSLAASYRLTEQAQVYARVENLLDENYEDVYGYNTPGVGAYAGLRLRF